MSHIAKRLILAAIAVLAIGGITPAAAQGRGGNQCPASYVYFNVNGIGSLDYAHIQYTGYLICTLAGSGMLGYLDALYAYTQNDQNVALTDLAANNYYLGLKSAIYNSTAYGSPTFTVDQGFTGVDGSSTVYINTGFTPGAPGATQCNSNQCYVGVWSNTNVTPASGGVAVGSTASGGCANGLMLSASLPTGHATESGLTTSSFDGGAVASSIGYFEAWSALSGGNMLSDFTQNANLGSPLVNFASLPASALPTSPVSILACNEGGTIGAGDPHQISVVAIGAYTVGPSFNTGLMCNIIAQYLNRVNGTTPPC